MKFSRFVMHLTLAPFVKNKIKNYDFMRFSKMLGLTSKMFIGTAQIKLKNSEYMTKIQKPCDDHS